MSAQIMLKSGIVSSDLERIPPFSVYYRGMRVTSNADGFFSFPLDSGKSNHYKLLICKRFQQNFDGGNTVQSLSITPQIPYQYFSLTRATLREIYNRMQRLKTDIDLNMMQQKLIEKQREKQTNRLEKLRTQGERQQIAYNLSSYQDNIALLEQRLDALQTDGDKLQQEHDELKKKYNEWQNKPERERQKDFWLISKEDLAKEQYVIPHNCIVLTMNPKIVDRIENWKFALPQNFVAFPKIVLKQGVEVRNVKRQQSLIRSSTKSELNFEAQLFHEKKQEEIKVFPGKPHVTVALVR